MKQNNEPKRIRTAATALITVGALLASASPASAQWRFVHSTPANSGFAVIETRPAHSPQVVRLFGPVAPGANPVIGPGGTVYIGNADGELQALSADGAPKWSRKINPEHGGFYGSPVVGADGSIYIVSTFRHEELADKPNQSYLHKFTPGGAWAFYQPLPKSAPAIKSAHRLIEAPRVRPRPNGRS